MTQIISGLCAFLKKKKKVKYSVYFPSIFCDSKQVDQYSNFGVDAYINIGVKKIQYRYVLTNLNTFLPLIRL